MTFISQGLKWEAKYNIPFGIFRLPLKPEKAKQSFRGKDAGMHGGANLRILI
jgi:hypothetical protein